LGGKRSTNELLLRWFHDSEQTYDIFSDFSQFYFALQNRSPGAGFVRASAIPTQPRAERSRQVAQRGNSD
jgi:hypothetical protein